MVNHPVQRFDSILFLVAVHTCLGSVEMSRNELKIGFGWHTYGYGLTPLTFSSGHAILKSTVFLVVVF